MPIDTAFCLSGEQTVRTIADGHRALLAYYEQTCTIQIDVAGVTDADVTLIQLIEAARVAASRDGKKVCITAHPPAPVRDILVRGGFLNTPANAIFWTAP